jgi:hypothetical protein
MKPVLWTIAALAIAGAILVASSLRTRRSLPAVELPDGEVLPKTVLQKRAGRTLLVVVALTAAASACLVWFGPQAWWENDAIRHLVTALLLGALIVFTFFIRGVRTLEDRDDGSLDERDAAIMNRSCAGVGGAMMVVMAAWMIFLIETHIETRLIPSYYLYLIFWSMVMTNVIASLAGILLAYRRS